MFNLKYKLEALLFSSARSMTIEELCNLTKSSPEEVREKLNELKNDYEKRDSSITLIDEGNSFKLNIKPEHIPVIQQIVTQPELSKTLMETLAVIAFKYPIKQSDIIKIRTNKAYDHLRQLEEMRYITRQKYSRTQLIKLTPKFFEYFDLPPERLKQKFESFEGISKAIKEKEEEIKKAKEEMKQKAKEAGKKESKEEPEIGIFDKEGHKKKLDIYAKTEEELEEEEAKEIKPDIAKLGNLEVVDVPEKEQAKEQEETTETEESIEEIPEEKEEVTEEEEKEAIEEAKEIVEEKETEEKAEETENKVDELVEKMLHPEEELEKTEEQVPKEKEKIQEKNKEEKTENQEQEEPEKQEQKETEQDNPETEQEPTQENSEQPSEEEPKDLIEAALEEEQKPQPKRKK